jgi:hypothetical protein
MARRIEWQEIDAICLVDTVRSYTVDIRLRWPRTTLDQTSWPVRIGAHCQTGYGVPAVTFSMLLLDGDVSELLEAVAKYRPDLLHYVNRVANRQLTRERNRDGPRKIAERLLRCSIRLAPSRHQDESLRLGPGAAC